MEQKLEYTMALLARTPAALDALLRDLPEGWTHGNEGGDTWSAYAVVAHLIHCEDDDWTARIRLILRSGDAQPFAPFDREGHVRYSRGKTLGELLDEFARIRAKNLEEVRDLGLTQKDLERRGRHPALGEVTLSQLLATWAAHDLTHLHQISRIMACQYKEAVGPWVRFLGVMQCAGHSAAA
jgi:hypothetical protein